MSTSMSVFVFTSAVPAFILKARKLAAFEGSAKGPPLIHAPGPS